MSRVDKFNPLAKGSAIDQKRDALRGGTSGKAQIEEPKFEEIRRDAINFGLATDVLYPISAGKEASIFLALWKDHPIVLKAYRLWATPHKLSTTKGHIRESSGKKTRWILGLIEDITVAEFDVLQDCFNAGVRIPTPISRVANYLTMRFIGDGETPAPQLREVELDDPEAVMNEIFDQYLKMYRDAHYTHGDLSAYNILWWKNQPWIIDVPQSETVNKWSDMNKVELFLRRDINNVLRYFTSYGLERDPEHILNVFLDAYIPSNLRNYRELRNEGLELT
ncbi:MAG: RIO1 family regulatory kinase/ATPase domain-containing protein [Candidatus Thorarchaeota archaeon]|jgi:RIO kinase 1